MSEEDRTEAGAVVLTPGQNQPLLTPEPFARDTHWDEADVAEWDDPTKLLWITVRLTARTQTAWKRLPEALKASYEAVKNALRINISSWRVSETYKLTPRREGIAGRSPRVGFSC